MNVIGNAEITSPSNKEETCILFIIDDTSVPFVLNNVTEKKENYVFSFWAKTDASASLKICEEEIAISTEWKRYKVNFTAIEENIKIFFNNPQIYYLYRAQLEKGNVLTDWKPSPGDINASLELKADKEKLISEINASADVIRLKSNRLVVESDNLQILEDGTLKTKRGEIADFDINEDGLTYGDVNSRVYTKISGDGIRWISGIEEYNYNEVADRIEAYYENRVFQFYRALKEEGNDSYDLIPIGGIDANGMYTGESLADWVNSPADYLVTWDGKAKFNKLELNGNATIGDKKAYGDGWAGFYIHRDGYMHIQRDKSSGHPYIAFYLDGSEEHDGAIRVNQDTGEMNFFGADKYTFEDAIECNTSIKFGGASAKTKYAIYTIWEDGSNHDIVCRDDTGLSSFFGWAGSSSYATVSVIRGRTCKYQNSSGTTTLSDVRLKKDFTDLDKWDSFYDALEPCAFKMKAGNSGRFHMGFKAQQVEKALLDNGMITQDFAGFIKMEYKKDIDDPEGNAIYQETGINEGDDEYGLIYTEFVALNTYQIQKLKNEVASLKREIETLKNSIVS